MPRAVALSSTTPAPADATPVEVDAVAGIPQAAPAQKSTVDTTVVARSERPDYASLIDQDQAAREQRCLAEAVYFEARSEPEEGQAAVAQVVLNRVSSGLYPSTVCGVVFQNRQRHNACQFSFACDGRALRVNEPEAWRTAVRIAAAVIDGKTYVAACRRRHALPRQLRAAALGQISRQDGRDRPSYLLPVEAGTDVRMA